MRKRVEAVGRFLSVHKIAVLAVIFFILMLVPVIVLTYVNRASGDDFSYGAYTHAAWVTTHSLSEVWNAIERTLHQYYYGWQGTWFSIFLFSLQPEVFSDSAYVIVAPFMLFLWIGSTFFLAKEVLVKRLHFGKSYYVTATILFLLISIEYIPSTKSSIFWFNGCAHYLVPFAMCQVLMVLLVRFVDACRSGKACADKMTTAGQTGTDRTSAAGTASTGDAARAVSADDRKKTSGADAMPPHTGVEATADDFEETITVEEYRAASVNMVKDFVGILVLMTLLGGSNYQAALFAVIACLYAIVGGGFSGISPEGCEDRFSEQKHRKCGGWTLQGNKKILLLLFPLITELLGLAVSMKAPGNKVRGGEGFGFSVGKALETVGQSFLQGITDIGGYFIDKPIVFIGLLALLFVLIEGFIDAKLTLNESNRRDVSEYLTAFKVNRETHQTDIETDRATGTKITQRMIGILAAFCMYCAMQAPTVYAGVEFSSGVYNMNYQCFLLFAVVVLVIMADVIAELFATHIHQKHMHADSAQEGFDMTDFAQEGFEVANSVKEGAASNGYISEEYFFAREQLRETEYADAKKSYILREDLLVNRFHLYIFLPGMILCCILVLLCKGNLKSSTTYKCLTYITSGQAADYKWQMDLQTQLLNTGETDVVLPFINNEQGPLMQMPVTDDPTSFTSSTTAQFYQKNSVVAMPRTEWEEIYGEGSGW